MRATLVNLIRKKGRISAAELTVLSGKHKSTISPYLQELIGTGVLREAGTSEPGSRGGKPRQLLELNPSYCHAIGIDASSERLKGVIYDFSGGILSELDSPYADSKDGNSFLKDLYVFIAKLIKVASLMEGSCLGIGIGFSGHIDSRKGLIYQSRSIGLKEYYLVEDLEKRFGLPMLVQNDANAALLAEKWYHLDIAGSDARNVLYFFIDNCFTSVGFGLMINGALYEGAQSLAGELNSYSDFQGVGPEMIRAIRACTPTDLHLEEGSDKIELSPNAQIARRLLDVYADQLVYAFELLNPEMLILGGNFDDDSARFIEPFIAYVRKKMSATFEPYMKIELRLAHGPTFSVCAGATVPLFMSKIASL